MLYTIQVRTLTQEEHFLCSNSLDHPRNIVDKYLKYGILTSGRILQLHNKSINMMELAKESINFAFWETTFEHVNLNSRGKFTLDGDTKMHSETFDDHNLERVYFIACFWTKNDEHVQISFVINMASFQISDVEWTVY